MSNISKIKVSYFPSLVDTKTCHVHSLLDVLNVIRNPLQDTRKIIQRVRSAKTKEEANAIKKELPLFTPSGTFSERGDDCLLIQSKVICLDLDDLADIAKTKESLIKNPAVVSVFISPRGTGLKVLIFHDVNDASLHKSLYYRIASELGISNVDKQCCNISRACFMSYDPDIYINESATPLHVDPSLLSKDKHKAVKESKTGSHASRKTAIIATTLTPEEIKEKVTDIHHKYEKYNSACSGNRNSTVFILSKKFHEADIPIEYTMRYLTAYYVDSKNGFTADEIFKTVKSAYK